MMSSTNKLSIPQSRFYMASSTGKNNQSFNKQLNNTEIEKNKLNTIHENKQKTITHHSKS